MQPLYKEKPGERIFALFQLSLLLARILRRLTRVVAGPGGMRISRKLKIDVPAKRMVAERVERSRRIRVHGVETVCAWGEKAGYDMSGMLYDPIFQNITSLASILPLLLPFHPYFFHFSIPLTSFLFPSFTTFSISRRFTQHVPLHLSFSPCYVYLHTAGSLA